MSRAFIFVNRQINSIYVYIKLLFVQNRQVNKLIYDVRIKRLVSTLNISLYVFFKELLAKFKLFIQILK